MYALWKDVVQENSLKKGGRLKGETLHHGNLSISIVAFAPKIKGFLFIVLIKPTNVFNVICDIYYCICTNSNLASKVLTSA